jgi:hypothetical protein
VGELTFAIRGRVEAADETQATERLMRMLKVFGFTDIGDGGLWLDRPRDARDDYGIALGEITCYVDSVDVAG